MGEFMKDRVPQESLHGIQQIMGTIRTHKGDSIKDALDLVVVH